MKMVKSSPEMIELFARIAPRDPDVTHKKMFGYPACFVNGNMAFGLHGDSLVVRLADPMIAEAKSKHGAAVFEPMPGRPMKQYVVAPDGVLGDEIEARRWLAESLAYVRSLPAKEQRARKKQAGK